MFLEVGDIDSHVDGAVVWRKPLPSPCFHGGAVGLHRPLPVARGVLHGGLAPEGEAVRGQLLN